MLFSPGPIYIYMVFLLSSQIKCLLRKRGCSIAYGGVRLSAPGGLRGLSAGSKRGMTWSPTMPDTTMGPRCAANLGIPKEHQGSWGLLCSAFWQGLVCPPRRISPGRSCAPCPSSAYQTALALLFPRVQYDPANTRGGSWEPCLPIPCPPLGLPGRLRRRREERMLCGSSCLEN